MQVQINNNNNTVDNIEDDVCVKVQYGNELRRFSIRRIECTGSDSGTASPFNNLVDKIALLFALPAKFQLKYKDDEGDFITISSDAELKFAIDLFNNSTLRLTINDVNLHTPMCRKEHRGLKERRGLKEHRELKERRGLKERRELKECRGLKCHRELKERRNGHDGHCGWKGHHGLKENKTVGIVKGRGCRGRRGWTSEDIENKIVMINKKRDCLLEKIEQLKKENSSEEKLNRLNCFLVRLDSRKTRLELFLSKKNRIANDSKCEKQIVSLQNTTNLMKKLNLCDKEVMRDVYHRGDGKCKGRGRGGKWRNDQIFNTLCALKKEKKEYKLAKILNSNFY